MTEEFVDFSRDLPIQGVKFNDGYAANQSGGRPWASGNGDGVIGAGDMSTAMANYAVASQKTTIEQTRLNGAYNLGGLGFLKSSKVEFGVELRDDVNTNIQESNQITMGNWSGVDPSIFVQDDTRGYFTPRDFADSFPDYKDLTSQKNL